MARNKNAQEEIMGFVLIIVVITVIGLAFLSFLRPVNEVKKTAEVSDLLYTVLGYTSSSGESIEALVKRCNSGFEESCVSLDSELSSALEASSKYISGTKGYSMNITDSRQLFYEEQGNITKTVVGDATFVRAGGEDIAIILRFYY